MIENGHVALLTVGKADLKKWCDDQTTIEQHVPTYVAYHEDKFVPRISLEGKKLRRAARRAKRGANAQ